MDSLPIWLQVSISIVSAGATAWTAGYFKWDFEKRKLRYEERKLFIKEARRIITTKDYFNEYDLLNSVMYSQLRKHLSKKVLKALEHDQLSLHEFTTKEGKNKNREDFRAQLITGILDDINDLEKKWGLL